ncbi:MAG: 30S ribosomal protein S8 [Clostridia bacterium]|nr:30S ribosomal protein S8 [Clostridia bacterium]
MMVTDPIADMLTRIRNAITAKHEDVALSLSKEKLNIAKILEQEGYISSFKVVDNKKFKDINISLKYLSSGENAIQGLKRISKPGLRIYANSDNLPKVISGLGIAILSTNKGIMTNNQAQAHHIGGEVLAYVW